MKLLYIASALNNSGGVAKLLSYKTAYLSNHFGYTIEIVFNELKPSDFFYDFDKSVLLTNLQLNNSALSYIFQYKRKISLIVKEQRPDVIVVCDNGIKGFLFPLLIKTTIPVVLEIHGSKWERIQKAKGIFSDFKMQILQKIKPFCFSKFTHKVFLSEKSASEWNVNNPIVIPNPFIGSFSEFHEKSTKTAVVIGRHSFEKGLDQAIEIWRIFIKNNPDWQLMIYGESGEETQFLQQLILEANLLKSVYLCDPIKNIETVYQNASVCLVTSRFEGFGMTIIEAMANGVVVVAYDCPIGPGSIIENEKNGFLIENGNTEKFAEKLTEVVANSDLFKQISNQAKQDVENYNPNRIMQKWDVFFKEIIRF